MVTNLFVRDIIYLYIYETRPAYIPGSLARYIQKLQLIYYIHCQNVDWILVKEPICYCFNHLSYLG